MTKQTNTAMMNGTRRNQDEDDQLTRIRFAGIVRQRAGIDDLAGRMRLVEAIGKARDPKFRIDSDNEFVYENFLKWIHGDDTMRAIDPVTRREICGNIGKGIYIAGKTGTGKTWCMDIMRAYCRAAGGFTADFNGELRYIGFEWENWHVQDICDMFADSGDISRFKRLKIIGINDLGSEPEETLYMGNRQNVMQQLIGWRGDRDDRITMFTSNMRLTADVDGRLRKRYGDRIVSRLFKMCNYFEMTGNDRRLP